MTLEGTADETVAIVTRGWYELPHGVRVSIADSVDRAKTGTCLYRPDDFAVLSFPANTSDLWACRIEVTAETSAEAARRLVDREAIAHVAALNFASAKNPGGGFLRGTKAQEEDLARCSALYACQLIKWGYYEENRASGTRLYTDHLIYSPDVPFFRDENLELIATPFLVSIITSPAPNAGEELMRNPGAAPAIQDTLRRRAEHVLRVAAHHGHRTLVLGAWGCGVFRNDPSEVASVFSDHLGSPRFQGAFDRVVFAIYDRTREQSTLGAFKKRFAAV